MQAIKDLLCLSFKNFGQFDKCFILISLPQACQNTSISITKYAIVAAIF